MTEREVKRSPLYQSLEYSVKLISATKPDDIDEKIMEIFYPLIKDYLQRIHYSKDIVIKSERDFEIKDIEYDKNL